MSMFRKHLFSEHLVAAAAALENRLFFFLHTEGVFGTAQAPGGGVLPLNMTEVVFIRCRQQHAGKSRSSVKVARKP
jgi:hypothetical protein